VVLVSWARIGSGSGRTTVFLKGERESLRYLSFVSSDTGQAALVSNPLHVFEQHFLSTPIIEFGGATIGMTGYPLSHLQGAIVF
jgi:hypothetical protein